MFNTVDFIVQLPLEVSYQILLNLNLSEFGKACLVSKVWQEITNERRLWNQHAEEIFNGVLPLNIDGKKLLQDYAFQCVRSNDEIIDRVQRFLDSLSFGQNGRFRCIIGEGKKTRMISIEIRGKQNEGNYVTTSEVPNLDEFDVKGACFIKSIGDGSLSQYTNEDYQGKYGYHCGKSLGLKESLTHLEVPSRGYFEGIVRFPSKSLSDISQLEQQIKNIVHVKLDSFAFQQRIRPNPKLITGIAVAILGMSFWIYYKRNNSK